MISINSIKKFLKINGFITFGSYIKSTVCDIFQSSIFGFAFTEIISSFALLQFTDESKENIHDKKKEITYNYPSEPYMYTIMTSSLKGITHYYIYHTLIDHSQTINPILFILKSFAVELIFDGFHYIIHRSCHEYPILYKHVHKKHHTHIHTDPISTFYMEPAELFVIYSVPLYSSLYILSNIGIRLSDFEFYLITIYMTIQEIGGHCGKKMYPTSSFAQFIWLPKLFNIQLYTEDHDIHHTQHIHNYSKRFSLFDKAFGTYKAGLLKNHSHSDAGGETRLL